MGRGLLPVSAINGSGINSDGEHLQGRAMFRRQTVALQVIWVAIFGVTCARSYADSFDTFGDHEKLSGHVVLAAGNVSNFALSQFSPDDPLQQQKARFYQIANFCFGW